MNTALVGSEAVDLLSRITRQKLSQRDLTPPVVFLAALASVLLGVIYVDGTVTGEEKQRLQTVFNQLTPSGSDVRKLAWLMISGVQQHQVYKKFNELLTLTAPLSEPERLLLIGFGYEMSAADGEMDSREKKYLEVVAKRLGINPQYLAILEAGFSHKKTVAPAALDEVQSLLDPARFQSLDAVFVKAASNMLAALPVKAEHKATQQHTAKSYRELKKFQEYRKQLDNHCYQLFQIIQECNNRGVLPYTLTKQIGKVSHKLQSQRFRVAVVGEFSQGKSTFLNALLGEEIQPVRAIPCSGTVTVLKYGLQKRVVCRYKDRRQEEIPFDQYQVKAAISEEAALSSDRDELARSDIEEIIFEHPDLDLCSSGVEIVDSPGLNECLDSTKITEKLLKDTDAVFFLTNASRPLTQWERNKISDLRVQLNGGKANEPVDNLFVLVNFMDLLRREKDRQDVRQRIERFVQGQNPIITGENRVHFISAQAALDAILDGTEDEYLKTFQSFTKSIEKFLTLERGSLTIKQSVTKIKDLIQEGLDGLHQAEDVLDGKLKIPESDKQKIFEQIGEASGREFKIRILAEQLADQSFDRAAKSWDEWAERVGDRIAEKSEHWYSQHSHIWSQDKLIRDYADQFVRDLSRELDEWVNKQVGDLIVKQNIEVLDREIREEFEAIRNNFQLLDQRLRTSLVNQLNVAATGNISGIGTGGLGIASSIDSDIGGAGGFLGGLGAGGLVAGALLIFTGLGIVPVILGGLAAAAGGSFGLGLLDVDGIHVQIKQKVYDLGFEKFNESVEEIFGKIGERIASVFNDRVEAASGVIAQAILGCENILEQQERVHQETLEQCEAEKAWIAQKRQELEHVQNQIEAILNQSPG